MDGGCKEETQEETGRCSRNGAATTREEQGDPKKRQWQRNPAIIVEGKPEDFPALAKVLNNESNHQKFGDAVVGKQTRKGEMLLKVRGGDSTVKDIKRVIKESTGEGVTVRSVQQKGLVEIRDISCWVDKEDVTEALTRAGVSEVGVVNLRKTFGSAQAATVVVPLRVAHGLVDAGRLSVGLLNCRVRICDSNEWYLRCKYKGHKSRDCHGPDRKQCCRRCGGEGHFAASCTAWTARGQ